MEAITFFLTRYLHFVAIIILVASVLIQHLSLQPVVKRSTVARMRKVNIVFAIFALIALVTGLGQWLWGVKPKEFYTSNGLLHTKILLLFVVAGLSVVPTIFLKKNEKGNPDDEVEVPKKVVMFLRFELLILFIMPLLGTLVAYGVGAG